MIEVGWSSPVLWTNPPLEHQKKVVMVKAVNNVNCSRGTSESYETCVRTVRVILVGVSAGRQQLIL
jgi:hypothetical protein